MLGDICPHLRPDKHVCKLNELTEYSQNSCHVRYLSYMVHFEVEFTKFKNKGADSGGHGKGGEKGKKK